LDTNPDAIYRELENCHIQAGENYIVAAGCEIPADTAHENVQTLREYAHNAKKI
jgi:uroporphyrinogen-III decarboxylase